MLSDAADYSVGNTEARPQEEQVAEPAVGLPAPNDLNIALGM